MGSSAVNLKDWVKSQAAGYWRGACFIPNASDGTQVEHVVSRFRELQDDGLVGGWSSKRISTYAPKGSPAYEYRALTDGGRVIDCRPRSEEAERLGPPPARLLESVAAAVPNPFTSADVGVDEADRWWLLEVGDGQVSGLPDGQGAIPLFTALADQIRRRES